MKSREFSGLSRMGCILKSGLLLTLVATLTSLSIAQGIDPNLRLGIRRTNQNVILNWFGSNAVSYQVESSSTLTSWVNSGPMITGQGAQLFSTNTIGGTTRGFFRVKRLVPVTAVTASFDAASGILTITGNDLDNTLVVSRNAAGALLVNGGAVSVTGGTPSVANTTLIQIFGRGGNDTL